MEIVVVGVGKVGYTVTEWLTHEDRHSITIVDADESVLKDTEEMFDVMSVHGNGAARQTLLDAGADRADIVIASTSSDEINLLCCFMARILGAKNTVARVRSPEYFSQVDYMKEEMGLGLAINPEHAAAAEISRLIKFPAAMKIDTFAEDRVEMVEFILPEGNMLCGMTLREMREKLKINFLIDIVERAGEVVIPSGEFALAAGDHVTVSSQPSVIAEFFKKINIMSKKSRNVTIVGGSKTAYYLAKRLSLSGVEVKIIEQDHQRCMELCNLLPDVTIIHGDGGEPELLDEEGIDSTDAFVALTGFDEENIIISIYAASKNLEKVIAKVNRNSYLSIVGDMGDISVISPKEITASGMLRFVRALENSEGSSVETLHKLGRNSVEALEFIVRRKSPYIGQPLRDLNVKDNTLIAGIVRNGKFFVPAGDDAIALLDRVLVVTTHKMNDLDDIVAANGK